MILLGSDLRGGRSLSDPRAVGVLSHLLRRDPGSPCDPRVSILKPIYGADDHFWPSYRKPRSHRLSRVRDPVRGSRFRRLQYCPSSRRLQSDYPQVSIRIIWVHDRSPERESGFADRPCSRGTAFCPASLMTAISWSSADYLDKPRGWLEDSRTGLVTCLYRAGADSFPASGKRSESRPILPRALW